MSAPWHLWVWHMKLMLIMTGNMVPGPSCTHYKGKRERLFQGPVVEPGPRRRPAEPQIVGSNPTRPANRHNLCCREDLDFLLNCFLHLDRVFAVRVVAVC